jgi:hypothetical protein
MGHKFLGALALAGVTATGIASPAAAQDYYGGGDRYYSDVSPYSSYDDDDRYQAERRAQDYRRYAERRREYYERQRAAAYQAYGSDDYADAQAYGYRYRHQRGYQCHSGTTGALIGAVLGGLLGREIGRGGAYDRPSTTGLIVGAGAGALAGRAVGRSGNDCR